MRLDLHIAIALYAQVGLVLGKKSEAACCALAKPKLSRG